MGRIWAYYLIKKRKKYRGPIMDPLYIYLSLRMAIDTFSKAEISYLMPLVDLFINILEGEKFPNISHNSGSSRPRVFNTSPSTYFIYGLYLHMDIYYQ